MSLLQESIGTATPGNIGLSRYPIPAACESDEDELTARMAASINVIEV